MRLRNQLIRLFCALLPIRKNRVVFSSYNGGGYSDSPKAICEALRKSGCGREMDLCWLVRNEAAAKTLPPDVRPVLNRGLKKLIALGTAKVWVDNCRKWEDVKRPGQFYLQTWHGFGPKRVEADVENVLEPDYVAAAKKDAAQCDLMVSGSKFMADLYHRAFWYDGPVELWGTPRCDLFFTDLAPIRKRVYGFFGLPADRKLLLYAPTFRADKARTDCYALDAARICKACQIRFGGDWTVLTRLHSNAAIYAEKAFAYDGDRVINATPYPDMQDLLCTVDVLITDYSSSQLDFPLAGCKPCFRFAADLEEYRKDRDLYMQDILPSPLAEDNETLERQILAFDEAACRAAWAKFAEQVGLCEDGRASERAAAWIRDKCKT